MAENDEQLAAAKAEHEKDIATHAHDQKALMAAKEAAHDVVKRIEGEKKAAEVDSAELKRLHDELALEHQSNQALTKRLQQEKEALQKAHAAAEKSQAQTKTEHDKAVATIAKLERQVEVDKEEHAKDVKAHERDAKALKGAKDAARSLVARLETENAALKQEIEQLKAA